MDLDLMHKQHVWVMDMMRRLVPLLEEWEQARQQEAARKKPEIAKPPEPGADPNQRAP